MNTGLWDPGSIIKKARATTSRNSWSLGLKGSSRQKELSGHCCSSGQQEEANAPRELQCSVSWIERHDSWILGFTRVRRGSSPHWNRCSRGDSEIGREENTCAIHVVFSSHLPFSSPTPDPLSIPHPSSSCDPSIYPVTLPSLPKGMILEGFLSSSNESTIGRRTERLVQSVRRKRIKGSSILAEDQKGKLRIKQNSNSSSSLLSLCFCLTATFLSFIPPRFFLRAQPSLLPPASRSSFPALMNSLPASVLQRC